MWLAALATWSSLKSIAELVANDRIHVLGSRIEVRTELQHPARNCAQTWLQHWLDVGVGLGIVFHRHTLLLRNALALEVVDGVGVRFGG